MFWNTYSWKYANILFAFVLTLHLKSPFRQTLLFTLPHYFNDLKSMCILLRSLKYLSFIHFHIYKLLNIIVVPIWQSHTKTVMEWQLIKNETVLVHWSQDCCYLYRYSTMKSHFVTYAYLTLCTIKNIEFLNECLEPDTSSLSCSLDVLAIYYLLSKCQKWLMKRDSH